MSACEGNHFCNCDGSCRQVAPRTVSDMEKMVGDWQRQVEELVVPRRHLFPDGVPDFTREACAQREIKIT